MLYRLMLVLAVVVGLPIISAAQQTQTLCTNQSNPAGWVTIHISTDFSSSCPLIQNNLKTIEQITTLASQATVAACNDGSSLPSGWVITAFGNSATDCGGFSGDEQTLFNSNGMPLNSQLVVCFPSSPIPTGWSAGTPGSNGQCGTTNPDAVTITRTSGPDLSLSASPSSQIVTAGSILSYKVTMNRIGGFTDAVTLTASSVPNGVTISFSPNNTTGVSSAMTVTTVATASPGNFTLGIDGVSGAYSRNTSVNLVIQQPATHFNPVESWTQDPYFGSVGTFFADVDGDAKADAIVVNSNGIGVRRSNGTSFTLPVASWTQDPYFGSIGTFFADVDGDGKADAIVVNSNGIGVRRSNGTSFSLPVEPWTADAFFGTKGTFFADVDGDKKADAIVVNDGFITVRRSTGNNFGLSESWTSDPFFGSKGTFFADVNGDGRADAIAVTDTGVLVRLSNGASFGPAQQWTTDPYFGSISTVFADVTGDHQADGIVVNSNGIAVRRAAP